MACVRSSRTGSRKCSPATPISTRCGRRLCRAIMPSEHAAQLSDSVSDFVARATDVARARALRGTPHEYDRTVWKQMAGLGWLGIAIPEAYGGMGLGLTETAIVAQGLARTLAPEPYTASAVLAAGALAACDNESLK